ncbi:MAG: hypothetical protein Q8L81_04940 [Bacteroidota bacterium]|nr:hypothetical protein [Bacteroidota bacterium]
MKKGILILIIVSLISCNNNNKNVEFVLDDDTGDTIKYIKRYPTQKIKELILYEKNVPIFNLGFNEKGDTLKIPRIIYVKANRTLFLYIPIQNLYSKTEVLFENTDPAQKNIDETLTITLNYIGSMDIPIVERMIKAKQINGFIKTTSKDKKNVDMWPFRINID